MATKTIEQSDPSEDAIALLEHPAEFGRLIGFTRLTDSLHEPWIMDMAFGKSDETIQGHRGSYKTTCLEIALALVIMVLRDKNVIFLRKTDNDVIEVINAVRNILLNPLTQALYKALTGTNLRLIKSTSTQITTNGYCKPGGTPQLLGIGLGGSLTGKHADIVVTDDIVNRLDRQSKAERESTKLIYMELQNIKNPGGRIFNSGTPWHKEDAFTLMPSPKKYSCYTTGMLSKEQIEDLKMKMAPSLFAANYELEHIASEGALFATTRPISAKPDVLRDGIAHIDAAYNGEDYTAFTCGKKVGDTLYLYGKIWRCHVDVVLDRIISDAQRMMCAPIHCEDNGDKGFVGYQVRDKGYYAYVYTESQNKYIKVSSYLRKWWQNVIFVEGTDPEYINQILDYTDSAEHDDAPDSAACIARYYDRR